MCIQAGEGSSPVDPQAYIALGDAQLADMPVVGVTWNQSQAYCTWVQGRLPTEAEWEKTARGPDGNIYPWGAAEPSCDLLNFNGCVGQTTKVTSHPNGKSYYEALDLAGNVFEWVGDWYDANYYQVAPTQDPPGPESGTQRSVRSSSYISFPGDVPASTRNYLEPEKVRSDLGFRCVVESPGSFVPFCQTSTVFIPDRPNPDPSNPNGCTSPVLASPSTYCQGDRGVVQVEVGTGHLASSDDALRCHQEGTLVVCSGNPETGVNVTVCNDCASDGMDDSTPQGDCMDGYILSAVGRNCDYLPDPASGVCPSGAAPMMNGDILTCVYNTPQNGNELPCPPGSYLDQSLSQCVSIGIPGNNCLSGFAYSAELACCQSMIQIPDGPLYPGCGQDEIYDPLLGGCVSSLFSAVGTGCTTIKMDTPACGQPDTEGSGCSAYHTPSACSSAGCTWDKMTGTCRR